LREEYYKKRNEKGKINPNFLSKKTTKRKASKEHTEKEERLKTGKEERQQGSDGLCLSSAN